MKKYILACLIYASMLSAANYQALDERPDFINLSPQPIIQNHLKQANLGQDAALVSANYINFNLNSLNIIKDNKGKFHNIENTQMSGQEISLRLPNVDKPVLLYVDNVQNLVEGVVTYTGYRVEDANDFFTLSIAADEGVMAKINYGKYIYIIKPIKSKSAKHTIAQLDKSLMVKDTSDDVVEGNKPTKSKNFVGKSQTGSGNVRVLFYFAADVWYRSLYTSTMISEMNAALSRSGVSSNNYISSAGIKVANSTFSGQCKGPILAEMSNNTGVFNNLDQELITYGADIAVLLVKTYTNQDCGFGSVGIYGRVGGLAYAYSQNDPFTVIADVYALGDLTALHEMGHIFGGAHAFPVYYFGAYSYSRGLIHYDNTNPADSWQTIMGSYGPWSDNCIFNGPYSSCERLNYFSNPNKTYNGIALGASNKNMKKSLNNTMPVVSGWRGAPIPPPSSPNPINVINICLGLNSVSWTAQTGATEYKLFKSNSSNFASPVMLYSGSNTATMINVNPANVTWYLRAQACNASGCSAYSNQVTANVINIIYICEINP